MTALNPANLLSLSAIEAGLTAGTVTKAQAVEVLEARIARPNTAAHKLARTQRMLAAVKSGKVEGAARRVFDDLKAEAKAKEAAKAKDAPAKPAKATPAPVAKGKNKAAKPANDDVDTLTPEARVFLEQKFAAFLKTFK